jgi:LuxR family transcriptional regulator, maltose regulon positive regulatory protein
VVDPSAETAARTDASGANTLLATKLYLPRLQAGFVARPRLLDQLGQALGRDLILVCAPAGFGKTALLADWARQGRWPIAWLSLDAADNDPARFWRHVVAALDPACPGIAGQLGPLFGPPSPRAFEGLVEALINELAPGQDPILFVLDDYHLIEAPQVHASLGFLLEHRPLGLRLVLSSRADPPLPLARLRARGQLTELRALDMRFTLEETAALLVEAVGPDVPEDAVAALAARTEGWVAGLQLAALSLRGHGDPDSFVASFSGSHRYVLDYLTEEVLDRQPVEVRGFLLETSVLDRVSGALCDAVTGRTDSQVMLERVERANLFLVPLDEVRGWWRYHHLFAELLRARLQRQQPERIAVLHRNAAAWLEEHGLADEAIRHALTAGDTVGAARLIERHFDALFFRRGEGATVQRWLAAIPAEIASSRPRLLLARSRLALVGGRLEAAGQLLDAAERAQAGAAGVEGEPFGPSADRGSWLVNVPAAVTTQRAYLAALRGDAEGAAAFASQALAVIGDDEWMLASHARGYLSLAEWMRGRLTEAEQLLSSIITQWRAAGERALAVRGCHHLGQIQRAQGRLDAALGTYQQAVDIAAVPGRPHLPAAGTGYVGMAEVAYQRGELDTALRHVTEGISLARQSDHTQPLANGLVTLAWIRQAQGDGAGALAAMDEAGQVGASSEVASLLNPAPAQRARLLLARGDIEAAAQWASSRGLDPDGEPGYPKEPEYLALARILIARDLPGLALDLLERLRAGAAAGRRAGSLIEILALQALALAARGDEAAALTALTGALTRGCPQGYLRVFADEGSPMGALLGRLIAAKRAEQGPVHNVPLAYLGSLLRCFQQLAAAPGRSAVPRLPEPLTEREREILKLLAAGKPNQQIARELVVSLATVKKHVTHVLAKLGAANRTEATARARELGLLP